MAYKDADKRGTVAYQRASQDLVQLKACLATGKPIIVGLSVYESFVSMGVAQTGEVPIPVISWSAD